MANDLTTRLKKKTRAWGEEIKKLAIQNLGKYSSLIGITFRTTENDGMVGLDITATAKNPDKPVARAYEYGSGIHSRVKARSPHQLPSGKILIAPKNKKVLAFFWEKLSDPPGTYYPNSKKLIKIDEDGNAMFRFVEHPGVKAANEEKGYLSPAIAKVRAKMRREITPEVRASVIDQFRKKFK